VKAPRERGERPARREAARKKKKKKEKKDCGTLDKEREK
jgi:hypothetical protein